MTRVLDRTRRRRTAIEGNASRDVTLLRMDFEIREEK